LAYFATAQTTAGDILDIIDYRGDDGTELVHRTRLYFENWVRTATQDMLVLLIQATSGSTGLTPEMKLIVLFLILMKVDDL
jgi:hypothetical protein